MEQAKDQRPGFEREPTSTTHCDCGATIVEGLDGLVHIGHCGLDLDEIYCDVCGLHYTEDDPCLYH